MVVRQEKFELTPTFTNMQYLLGGKIKQIFVWSIKLDYSHDRHSIFILLGTKYQLLQNAFKTDSLWNFYIISSIQAHPMPNCFRMRFWSLGWRGQGPIRWQKLPSATRLTLVRLSAANSMTVTDATAAVGAAAWSEDQLYLKEFLHK